MVVPPCHRPLLLAGRPAPSSGRPWSCSLLPPFQPPSAAQHRSSSPVRAISLTPVPPMDAAPSLSSSFQPPWSSPLLGFSSAPGRRVVPAHQRQRAWSLRPAISHTFSVQLPWVRKPRRYPSAPPAVPLYPASSTRPQRCPKPGPCRAPSARPRPQPHTNLALGHGAATTMEPLRVAPSMCSMKYRSELHLDLCSPSCDLAEPR